MIFQYMNLYQLKQMLIIAEKIFISMCSYDFWSFCCKLIWIVTLILIVGIDFVLLWVVTYYDGNFEDIKYGIIFLAASTPVFVIGACIVNFNTNNKLISKNTSTEDAIFIQIQS